MKQVRMIIFLIFFFLTAYAASGDTVKSKFINTHNNPISINVEYYDGSDDKTTIRQLILEPGSLYVPGKNSNGYVYKKYALMPQLAEELIRRESAKEVYLTTKISTKDERLSFAEKLYSDLSSSRMPEDWISKNVKEYQDLLSNKKNRLDKLLEKNQERGNWDFAVNDLKKDVASLLEIEDDAFAKLSDPMADPDKDGLINREELRSNKNPLIKDTVVFSPANIEIVNGGGSVLTGRFAIINLTDTNAVYRFSLDGNVMDKRFCPKLICLNMPNLKPEENTTYSLSFEPKQTIEFLLLFDKGFMPTSIEDNYSLSIFNNGTAKLFSTDDYGIKLDKPILLNPKDGQCITSLKNFTFSWKSGDKFARKDWMVPNYYLPEFHMIDGNIDNSAFNFLISEDEFAKIDKGWEDRVPPGIYVWRVVKQTDFSNPVSSDWGWFAIGEEIFTNNKIESSEGSNHETINNDEIYEVVVGKEFDFPIYGSSNFSKSKFEQPLPKGFKYFRDDNGIWHLNIKAEQAGISTNMLYSTKNGKPVRTKHYFVVRNSKNKNVSRSFYDLVNSNIVHEAYVNVPFKYEEISFFNEFFRKERMVLNNEAKIENLRSLPDGLKGERESDGKYTITGTPSKAGDFIVPFKIISNGISSEETHVFKIKDIGEPKIKAFVPEKPKIRTKFWVGKNGEVKHYLKVGDKLDYCFHWDKKEYSIDYERFRNNSSISVIGDNPPGITIGNIPFSAKSPMAKKYQTAKGFVGTPLKEGCYTNYLRVVEMNQVTTNRHIFYISQ